MDLSFKFLYQMTTVHGEFYKEVYCLKERKFYQKT